MSKQRDNLKGILVKYTMKRYDAGSPKDQREGMKVTLETLLDMMPLKGLRQLHQGMVLADMVQQPKEEQCPNDRQPE